MPQIQFIHRRLVFQLWRRDKYPQCMLYSSQAQFLDTVLDMPVVVLRQVSGSMVQKTVVLPQLQSIDPTSFLDHVYLGCTQRQCEVSQNIVDNYRTMFESRISAGDWKNYHSPKILVFLHGRMT